MAEIDELVERCERYKRLLQRPDKIESALRKLERMPMTVQLLTATHIGRFVNQLRQNTEHGERAAKLVEVWKDVARREGLCDDESSASSGMPTPNSSNSSSPDSSYNHQANTGGGDQQQKHESVSTPSHSSPEYNASAIANHTPNGKSKSSKRHRSRSPRSSKKQKETKKHRRRDRSSGSPSDDRPSAGATSKPTETSSFDVMLMQQATAALPPRAKKLRPSTSSGDRPLLNLDINYKPLPIVTPPQLKQHDDERGSSMAVDPGMMFKAKSRSSKMYAGRRKAAALTEVPTLFSIAMREVCNHPSVLETSDELSFVVVRPVLERCSAEQLARIEDLNPHLEEDTDVIWERLAMRRWPQAAGHSPNSGESWRQYYARLQDEDESRLRQLSSRINANASQYNTGRKAILAAPKAPVQVRRAQMKYGTAGSSAHIPDAVEVTRARREIFERGNKAAVAALPAAVKNLHSTLGSHSKTSASNGKKPGALMAKVMKMMKNRR